ncbi:MAG: alpha/beta fold hydrolase [Archangium sp.]
MNTVWLIIVVTLVLIVGLDGAFVSWMYELDDRPARLEIPTSDGWTVVAWHRAAEKRQFSVPIVLCHGLANNHAFMEFRGEQNLAKYLAAQGFDCYSVDLRGAGGSLGPDDLPTDASVDDHVRYDVPAIIEAVCKHSGSSRVAWVGHSLGGVVAVAAASSTLPKDKLAALVTIGTPVFFRLPKSLRSMLRWAKWLSPSGQFAASWARLIAPFAGRTPVPKITDVTANLRNVSPLAQRYLMANVFAPIWRGVIEQLDEWLATDTFKSRDGKTDYRENIKTIEAPTLVIGGTVDLLSPPDVTRDYFNLLTAPVRQLEMFGKSYGHSSEYGHGDLVIGMNAHLEVYPVIHHFLASNLREE